MKKAPLIVVYNSIRCKILFASILKKMLKSKFMKVITVFFLFLYCLRFWHQGDTIFIAYIEKCSFYLDGLPSYEGTSKSSWKMELKDQNKNYQFYFST